MSFLYPVTELASAIQETKTPWGITIYRTTYTPLSDLHFDRIVELIGALLKENIRTWKNSDDDEQGTAYTILKENYQPIVMNDRSTFDGMTFEDARVHQQSYIELPEGTAGETTGRPWTNENFFIVVDEEVVQTLAELCDQVTPAQLQEGSRDDKTFFNYANRRKWWVKVAETELWEEDDKGWMKCSIFMLWNLWSDMNGEEGMSTWEAMAMRSGVYTG
ncbi:uncharacterized protein DSM5745_09788 [Aspergillus mulundensis]|uniref:Uncharacterized protein n=1 Tax=Aspergillus mulundensis TaxID=1810919 RepID=A0A3D8QRH1_9EURO|nr:hypothetical protein DSM5745_09788 [Aspergillus mulundensis]RDW64377.1 hypothetical protein DSM5745_09788 [Aspergillus mulundensis]